MNCALALVSGSYALFEGLEVGLVRGAGVGGCGSAGSMAEDFFLQVTAGERRGGREGRRDMVSWL